MLAYLGGGGPAAACFVSRVPRCDMDQLDRLLDFQKLEQVGSSPLPVAVYVNVALMEWRSESRTDRCGAATARFLCVEMDGNKQNKHLAACSRPRADPVHSLNSFC